MDSDANGYTFRRLAPRDNAAIARIARAAFEEFGAPRTGSVYSDPRMDNLSAEFARDDAEYWVVERGGAVLGGCGFFPTEGLPHGMAEVVKFYFAPELRGMGFGRRMLAHIEERARAAGYRRLYIESFPEFGRAVSLYEKAGFTSLPHVLGNSGHTSVTIYMAKDIAGEPTEQ